MNLSCVYTRSDFGLDYQRPICTIMYPQVGKSALFLIEQRDWPPWYLLPDYFKSSLGPVRLTNPADERLQQSRVFLQA